MPSKYATMYTPEEMEEYRARKKKEKEAAEKEALKAEETRAAEASKRRRDQLTETLRSRYLASGGTTTEWLRSKERLVADAIANEVLNPVAEPPKPKIAAPVPRRMF